jgi:hypothetical protein
MAYNPSSIALSSDGQCLAVASVSKLDKMKKHKFTLVTPSEIKQKKFAEVETKIGRYYADVVTGSLYDMKTGECLTSMNLRIADLHTLQAERVTDSHSRGSKGGLSLATSLAELKGFEE